MKSLTTKVMIILLSVFILYGAVAYGIIHFIIFPSFLALENGEARKDVERSIQAINREIFHLDSLAHDWSAWDDTYEFAESSSEDYIETNLTPSVFTIISLNLIYICDPEGKVIWGEIHDLETEEMIHLADFPQDALPQTHPLISYKTDQVPPSEITVAGVFMTAQGPMLISSRPVLNNNNEGPIRGAFIMGRFLDDTMLKNLVDQTRVDFKIFPIQADGFPEALKNIPKQLTSESPYVIKSNGDEFLQVYSTFPDIKGDAALLISAKIPRKILARGTITIRYTIVSTLTVGLVILMVILLLLQRTVLRPVTHLTNHAVSVGKSGDLSVSLSIQRLDEIGTLAREFDRMLGQLSEARKELLEQSYLYGMAEMASGVLHNVRNSLNPIIGHIELLRDNLRKAPIKQIEMAQKELSEGTLSDERREELNKFLMLTNKSLTSVIQDMEVKLNDVTERIIQIENILDDHQKWAYSERPAERLTLEELVHDSIKFIKDDYREVISIRLDPEISEVGALTAHRIALMQVFANILINAAESIRRQGLERGEVHIQAGIVRENDEDMIHIQVYDNGEGLEADVLEHIFERGFSTKQEGSSGMGLHWCANTISSMHGKIYAESEGRGKGACLHLVLPQNLRKNS